MHMWRQGRVAISPRGDICIAFISLASFQSSTLHLQVAHSVILLFSTLTKEKQSASNEACCCRHTVSQCAQAPNALKSASMQAVPCSTVQGTRNAYPHTQRAMPLKYTSASKGGAHSLWQRKGPYSPVCITARLPHTSLTSSRE